MATNDRPPDEVDLTHFIEGRNSVPLEQLLPYAGQYVAWSPDGKRIVASGEDRDVLTQKLQSAGISISQVVYDYIDPPDEVPFS
jgi:hypothetical protein